MKIIKRLSAILLVAMMMLPVSGCGSDNDGPYKIYYISTDKTSMVPIGYTYAAFETDDMVAEALKVLAKDVDSVDYMKTIPTSVSVLDYNLSPDGMLAIYLSKDYTQLEPITEILVRAAIVHTMVQIDGVKSVSFYVSNTPLEDSTGAVVGAMTAESFIDDFGQETDSLLYTTLTLYFASADGASVVAEEREVYYSRNVTKERLIMDQLMKGPEAAALLDPIPEEAKLVSVTVTDGVCYVNFDSGIESTLVGVSENTTIYSIVNSLTELDSITAVQILVNGKTPHLPNIEDDLSNQLTRNVDIISDGIEEDRDTDWSDLIVGPDITGGNQDSD